MSRRTFGASREQERVWLGVSPVIHRCAVAWIAYPIDPTCIKQAAHMCRVGLSS
jgi:hypothetical protein